MHPINLSYLKDFWASRSLDQRRTSLFCKESMLWTFWRMEDIWELNQWIFLWNKMSNSQMKEIYSRTHLNIADLLDVWYIWQLLIRYHIFSRCIKQAYACTLETHLEFALRALRYLKNNSGQGLFFPFQNDLFFSALLHQGKSLSYLLQVYLIRHLDMLCS